MQITRSALLALLLLFIGTSALAQEYPKFEFSGGYSYARMGGANWSGWVFEAAKNLSPKYGIVLDASAPHSSMTQDVSGIHYEQSRKTYALMIGPQFASRGPYKLTPFGHLLIGAVVDKYNITESLNGLSYSGSDRNTELAMAIGGGIDYKWKGPICVRGQMDYMGFRIPGNSSAAAFWEKGIRMSIGLAIRLGKSQ